MTIPAGLDEGLLAVSLGEGVALGRDTPLELVAESQGKQVSAVVTVRPIGRRASIDRAYGTNGFVPVGGNGGDCQTYPLADGKLLVNVSSPGTVYLVQLDRAGHVDTTFASIGYVYLEQILPNMPRERYSPVKVAIQRDGKILLATSGDDPATPERPDALVLLRLNANGTLDTSYDSDGIIRIDGALRAYSLGLTPNDEAILVYGAAEDTWIRKLASNGANRITTLLSNTLVHLHSDIIVNNDERFIIPMYVRTSTGGLSPALVRFTPMLTLDPLFGRDGVMSIATALFNWLRTSSGAYVGIGSREQIGRISAHVAAYGQTWGALPGFENGGITFSDWPAGALVDGVETRDGTLVVGVFGAQGAQAAHIFANGSLDLSLGVKGLSPILAPAPDGPMSLSPASEHTAYYSYVRSGQPCQLYKIWR